MYIFSPSVFVASALWVTCSYCIAGKPSRLVWRPRTSKIASSVGLSLVKSVPGPGPATPDTLISTEFLMASGKMVLQKSCRPP